MVIKPRTEWTFTEWQSHAAGFLEGIIVGVVLAVLLYNIGYGFYLLAK